MNTHIDTMREWYENAEQGTAHAGDTVIQYDPEDGVYEVCILEVGPLGKWSNVRILERASKPKPAWHDAPAIRATYRDENGVVTGTWIPARPSGYWEGPEGDVIEAEYLESVTPLIEARVTDEMRDRVRDHYRTEHQVELPRDDEWLNTLLGVALGLPTD